MAGMSLGAHAGARPTPPQTQPMASMYPPPPPVGLRSRDQFQPAEQLSVTGAFHNHDGDGASPGVASALPLGPTLTSVPQNLAYPVATSYPSPVGPPTTSLAPPPAGAPPTSVGVRPQRQGV